MKKLIILALVLIASTAFAAGTIEKTGEGNIPIQGFAPNGTLGQALTVNSTTVPMVGRMAFGVFVPSTTTGCKLRMMPTTAKSTYRQATVPDSTWNVRVVNSASPFANFSGCTSGELTIQ